MDRSCESLRHAAAACSHLGHKISRVRRRRSRFNRGLRKPHHVRAEACPDLITSYPSEFTPCLQAAIKRARVINHPFRLEPRTPALPSPLSGGAVTSAQSLNST